MLLVALVFSFRSTWAYFKDSKAYSTSLNGQVAYNQGLSYTIEGGDNSARSLDIDFTDGNSTSERTFTLILKNNSSYRINLDSISLKPVTVQGNYYNVGVTKISGDSASKELKYSLKISKTNVEIPADADKFMIKLTGITAKSIGNKTIESNEIYNLNITPKYDIAPTSTGSFRVGSYIDHYVPSYGYWKWNGKSWQYEKQLTGLVTEDGFVWVDNNWWGTSFHLDTKASYDKPEAFDYYVRSPENRPVNMLWLEKGWLTYRIPKIKNKTVDKLEIEMEIASEVEGHRDNYESPITFGLGTTKYNIQDIAVWTSRGDYGDKRTGKMTPSWRLPRGINQYGYKIKLIVTKDATHVQVMSKLDGLWKSGYYYVSERNQFFSADADQSKSHGYSSLTSDSDYYYFRIQTYQETGFTLYGSGFGDYGEDMKYTITYR